jgi:hypothetical protein
VETADAGEFPESVRTYPAATDWLGTISVSTLERLAGERGSIPAVRPFDDEEEWSTGPADVIGTVVHAVLQRWEPAHAENWRDLLEACLITVAPADREAVSEAAERLIERFFESPLRGDLATAREEFREVDFALQWPVDAAAPRAILTGQIDLLQRVDSGWRLLDYKTGNFPVDAPNDELLAPYALQLGIYALAAERMLGEPLASIGLVVLRPEVRWLPFSWTERDRRQLISRIDDSLKRMIQADSAGVAVGLPR